MALPSNEARVILALKAVKRDKKLSFRAIAKLYDIPLTTLLYRRASRPTRRDTSPNSRKLTKSEEEAIIQYILKLGTRSFPPRLYDVEEMANELLRVRDASPMGIKWSSNFVRRRPELYTRFYRKYDYQRAKCEDRKAIGEWFDLVRNMKAKHGILDDDTYNFDETGFMIGIIHVGMVVTSSNGRKAKLAQPGNREWATVIRAVGA